MDEPKLKKEVVVPTEAEVPATATPRVPLGMPPPLETPLLLRPIDGLYRWLDRFWGF